MSPNLLLYGDNLDFLQDFDLLPTGSVDLVYLDPPFNSNVDYNVLFAESGEASVAQVQAFVDTWNWDTKAAECEERLTHGEYAPNEVKALIGTFRQFLGRSPMLAYLVQMALRLVHLRRVLKNTGSLYLHCDPTASHYLKLVLDGVFGPRAFRAEIIWQRTNARSTTGKWPRMHDVILHYESDAATFRSIRTSAPSHKMPHTLITGPDGKKYQTYELTAPGRTKTGDSGRPWRGFDPSRFGRHWANNHATMDNWAKGGLIHFPKNSGFPRRRAETAFDERDRLITVGDVWTDIDRLNQTAQERLGYPTQKPLELLKRIVLASSRPGDLILDPFCGCGTTIDAVETINREHPGDPPRRWIGIDITHLAINLIKYRLSRFDPPPVYEVRGEPRDLGGARQLAQEQPYQFQFWACGLVGARPAGAAVSTPKTGKKGADRGIDGVRYFVDDKSGPKPILVQVKGGKVGAAQVRDFVGTVQREGAAMGIFISLNDLTKPMRQEAAAAGMYGAAASDPGVPKIQVVTIEQLLSGGTPRQPAGVLLPRGAEVDRTFKKAQRHDAGALFAQPGGG
ncbi:MAG: restriction endonuclease [Phycisphaerales bacterium]|nr:restriction endonuclease [Phycisphaerales bacterium]